MKLGLKRNEIRLVPYADEWHKEFMNVKQNILNSTPIQERQIEHVGSTAIKGMVAKPILDIAIGVDDINNVGRAIFQGLNNLGFLRLRVERPNEIVLAKFTDETCEEKTHYIHLVEYGNELWENLIFFRDYLISNDAAREQYKNLKNRISETEKWWY